SRSRPPLPVPSRSPSSTRTAGSTNARKTSSSAERSMRSLIRICCALAILVVGGALAARDGLPAAAPARVSGAIPEARGEIKVGADGKRIAVRYKGWTTRDFSMFRTYAYDDTRAEPAPQLGALAASAVGDPKRGRALFLDRQKGPCTGCHLVPGEDVWPAGSVGPDLSTFGDRHLPDALIYQQLWDPRLTYPSTVMPRWGAQKIFTPDEIVDLVAYLKTLRGPVPAEQDTDRNPFTRRRSTGFGDNLDPTNNPAVVRAEDAAALW